MNNSFNKEDVISFVKNHGIEGSFKELEALDELSDFQSAVLKVLFILDNIDRKIEFKFALLAVKSSCLSGGEILDLASSLGVYE